MKTLKSILFFTCILCAAMANAQWGGSTTTTGTIWRSGDIFIGSSGNPTGVLKFHTGSNMLGIYTWADATPIRIGGSNVIFQTESNTPNLVTVEGKLRIGYNSTSWDNWRLRIRTEPTNATYVNGFLIDHTHTTGWSYAAQTIVNNDNAIAYSLINNTRSSTPSGNQEVVKILGSGKIYATEVQVQLPPFPDYVFLPAYKLKTLKELESYINAEKHLPGIPSEQEIAANGIGVGELQVKLVEKIEELTLYILQLNKKIEELEAKTAVAPGN